MPGTSCLARPFLAALFTLAVTLVPAGLAVRHFQRAAHASDAAIFAATSATVEEKLRLATVRHLNWLNTFRNRLGDAPALSAAALDRQLPRAIWRGAPPHWLAVACVDSESVIWTRAQQTAPLAVGEQLAAHPALGALLSQSSAASATDRQPAWSLPWRDGQLCVAMSLPGGRGAILGWLDLDALCRAPSSQLSGSPGALTVRLGADAGPESRLTIIRESHLEWSAVIARGPRYADLLAHPPARYPLAAAALTALLLATLAGVAAQARLDSHRAVALRAALDAEREVGQMRSQFVSTVSHEFRTPLSVILSSADLLEAYGGQLDTARRGEAIAQIQDSTRRISEMVDEVLLPGLDGLEILAALRADAATRALPFIFLTARGEPPDIRAGMNLGADDYLPKPVARADLLAALRTRLARAAQQRPRSPDFTAARPLERLGISPREAEVLLWMAQGKANHDIAAILGCSHATVKKHAVHLFEKLGVETRAAAMLVAIESLSAGPAPPLRR